MGRRSRRRGGPEALQAPVSEYPVLDGTLGLRGALTPATRRGYADLPAGTREDAWQRRVEFLFERLAVSWSHPGLPPIERQQELLARYRMAGGDERAAIRAALREHLAEWFPDMEAP